MVTQIIITCFCLLLCLSAVHFGDTVSITAERYSWQKQECLKGINFVVGTSTAGWSFHCIETNRNDNIHDNNPNNTQWVRAFTPEDATNLVATGTISSNPVFNRSIPEMLHPNISTNMQNEIIAYAIPALSGAMGRTHIKDTPILSFDMTEKAIGWGRNENSPPYKNR